MNIAKEIAKLERKQSFKNTVHKIIGVLKTYLCTHSELAEEILLMDLGNSEDSILSEIFGKEEAAKSHQMKVRRVYCVNCGRIMYQEIISDVVNEEDQTHNK